MKTQFTACPKCGNVHVKRGEMNVDTTEVWQKVVCTCGFMWNDVWAFAGAEDPDTCQPLNEKGEVA